MFKENRSPEQEYNPVDGVFHTCEPHKVHLVHPLRRDLFVVKTLTKDHPAYAGGEGKGMFALKRLPRGTVIGEYAGEFTENRRTDRRSVSYQVETVNGHIDGSVYGNEVRYSFFSFHLKSARPASSTISAGFLSALTRTSSASTRTE